MGNADFASVFAVLNALVLSTYPPALEEVATRSGIDVADLAQEVTITTLVAPATSLKAVEQAWLLGSPMFQRILKQLQKSVNLSAMRVRW